MILAPLGIGLGGCATQSHTNPSEIRGPRAAAAYDLLKRLEGEWESKSTKGWGGRVQWTMIAGGSALCQFDNAAHPGQMMLTLIHPDGDRLLLTHFCAAKNQPRLVLTRASDDGKEFTFEFLDATNLASRDVGHMDQVTFTFDADDNYTERWMWYSKGKMSKMEDVVSRRISRGTPSLPTGGK